ncbi:unnamed protein product [Caenorhabditis brenneri]
MSTVCALAYNLGAPKKIWYYIALYCMIVYLTTFFIFAHAILGVEGAFLLCVPLIFFIMFTSKEEHDKLILDNAGSTATFVGVLVHIELMGWFVSLLCFLGYWALYLMNERITELMEENEKLRKAMEQAESTDDIVVVEEADLSAMEMEDEEEEEEEFDFEVIRYKDILIA